MIDKEKTKEIENLKLLVTKYEENLRIAKFLEALIQEKKSSLENYKFACALDAKAIIVSLTKLDCKDAHNLGWEERIVNVLSHLVQPLPET